MRCLARALVLACALATGACAAPASGPKEAAKAGTAPKEPAASLEGTRWVAAGAKGEAASAPRLEFTREGRVAGFTGCNMLSGSYRVEGDRLDVVAATTKRACLGPGGEAEQQLLSVLGDRPRWRFEGSRLVLTGARGTTFELDSAVP